METILLPLCATSKKLGNQNFHFNGIIDASSVIVIHKKSPCLVNWYTYRERVTTIQAQMSRKISVQDYLPPPCRRAGVRTFIDYVTGIVNIQVYVAIPRYRK